MASARNANFFDSSFHSSILEGCIKFRDKKTWKRRFCVVRRLSPVANSLIMQLYKKPFNKTKGAPTMKASINLEHLLGIENCFQLQKESQTLAIICKAAVVILAFENREMLLEWQAEIAEILGHGERYEVQLLSVPAKFEITSSSAVLHLRDWQFSLLQGIPPRVIGSWNIADLRRFGAVDDRRFCFEGGSRCSARGVGGLFVLGCSRSHEIGNKFDYAGRGRLSDSLRSNRVHGAGNPTSTLSGLLTPITRHRLSANGRSQSLSKPNTPLLSSNRRVAEFCLSPPCTRHVRSGSQQHSRTSSISSGTRVSSSAGLLQLDDPEILYDKPRSLNATTTQAAIYETPLGDVHSRPPSSALPAIPVVCQPTNAHYEYDTPRRVLQRLDADRNRMEVQQHPDGVVGVPTAVYATVTKPKKIKTESDRSNSQESDPASEQQSVPMEVPGYLVMQHTQGQWAHAQEYVKMQALPCSPATLLQRDQHQGQTNSNWMTERLYANSIWLQLQAEGVAETYQNPAAFRCVHPKLCYPIHGTLPIFHSRSSVGANNVNLRLRRSASMPAESGRQGNRDSSDSTDSGVSVTANDSFHHHAVAGLGTTGCTHHHHLVFPRHWSTLPRHSAQHQQRKVPVWTDSPPSKTTTTTTKTTAKTLSIPGSELFNKNQSEAQSNSSSLSNMLDQLETLSVASVGYETSV